MEKTTIPIGPQHPLLKEPLSLRIKVSGEQVLGGDLRLGYVHRGIERLAQEPAVGMIRVLRKGGWMGTHQHHRRAAIGQGIRERGVGLYGRAGSLDNHQSGIAGLYPADRILEIQLFRRSVQQLHIVPLPLKSPRGVGQPDRVVERSAPGDRGAPLSPAVIGQERRVNRCDPH